ncbi:hypothetical protein SNARM312S_02119 [Streptomyces narbonensis]
MPFPVPRALRRYGTCPTRLRKAEGRCATALPRPTRACPSFPGLAALLAAAAGRAAPEPPGGGPVLREAAAGYWWRRGLRTHAEDVVAAPGAPALLLALIAAHGGDLLLPRPCPAWWAPQARLLGRPAYHVPTPAECGGVPDPDALLETVRECGPRAATPGS